MNKLEYQEIHRWLRKNYGRANRCESSTCVGKSKYYDWALLNGYKYEHKRVNFIMLCKKCHSNYDNKFYFVKGHKLNNGRKFTEYHKMKISASNSGNRNHMFGMIGELNPFYGKKHSKETIMKLKEINKGKIPWNKGIPMSEESKVKLSVSQKIRLSRKNINV